jgi:hypothetical protein
MCGLFLGNFRNVLTKYSKGITMSTELFRKYIDIVNENQQPQQLDEGILSGIQAFISKIKAMPGIQKFIQAAQAKKDALIQAANQSSNAQDLIKNIQAAMGGQQAVAEGWGNKLAGTFLATAGGGLMATGAELFFRAWNAMGKPDLSQMMNDPGRDGQIVLALVSMLVVVGAVALFGGGYKVKQDLENNT